MPGELTGWIFEGEVYCPACTPSNDCVPIFNDTQVYADLYCCMCGEPVANVKVLNIEGAIFPQTHPGTRN